MVKIRSDEPLLVHWDIYRKVPTTTNKRAFHLKSSQVFYRVVNGNDFKVL